MIFCRPHNCRQFQKMRDRYYEDMENLKRDREAKREEIERLKAQIAETSAAKTEKEKSLFYDFCDEFEAKGYEITEILGETGVWGVYSGKVKVKTDLKCKEIRELCEKHALSLTGISKKDGVVSVSTRRWVALK